MLVGASVSAAAETDAPVVSLSHEFRAQQAWLVYATGYTGAPPSLFGHVLLVLSNPTHQGPNRIAVQYAAALDNGITFAAALRGVFSTLPGDLAVTPYYLLIRGYRNIEMRDLWEYPLDLTQEELDRLCARLGPTESPERGYNFIGNNCADGLLALLRDIDTRDRFSGVSSPILSPLGLVRLLRQHGLLQDPQRFPSIASEYLPLWRAMSDQDRQLVRQLSEGRPASHTAESSALVHRATALRLQAAFHRREIDLSTYDARLAATPAPGMLAASAAPVSAADPSRSAPPGRIRAGLGVIDGKAVWQLGGRFGYQERSESAQGLMPWSAVRLGDITVEGDGDHTYLRSLILASVESLDPGVEFARLNAWRVEGRYDRPQQEQGRTRGAWELETAIGRSAAPSENTLFYALVGAIAATSHGDDAWLGKAEIGMIHHTTRYAADIKGEWRINLEDADYQEWQLRALIQVPISSRWSLIPELRWLHDDRESCTTLLTTLAWSL